MKQRIISFIAFIMLIAGLSLMLYPTVSNYMQTTKHRRAIYSYLESVDSLSDDEYEQILASAQEYNSQLAQRPMRLMNMTREHRAEYESLLDITGTGIMGYIDIPKADVYLPVYHGVSESVLQIGIGHIEGSSLPVGGVPSHCIVSGHRGLPSAKLFTNLDKLKLGDTFTLIVLNEAYIYMVDDISVIRPTDTKSLKFYEDQDYCTLVTCTPYGINTHRLLVRGKRVHVSVEEEKLSVQSGASYVNVLYILAAIEIPVFMISVNVSASAERKRNRKMRTSSKSSRR